MSANGRRQRVAVIGAGAAGLATARELLRAGHEPLVFEQSAAAGGIWVYEDGSGRATPGAAGRRVHSSLYASLRTNLPRDLMAFVDYPFDSSGGGDDDWPRFPHHTQVRQYLERFAVASGVAGAIRFGARVTRVERAGADWQVTVETAGRRQQETVTAVAVCCGHYAEPRVPDLPGMATFPGALSHSHDYRRPEPFAGKTVALLGTSASGVDLAAEIGGVARTVYWCGRAFETLEAAARRRGSLCRMPAVVGFGADGRVHCSGGLVTAPVDAFVFCTGYRHSYPFLDSALLSVDDNFVTPLYQDLLHVDEPTLACIGIPFRVVPFPLFAVQACWFARLLAGHFATPGAVAMRAAVDERVAALRAAAVAQRHFHQRTIDCHDYLDALAAECGTPPMPQWHRQQARAFLDHVAAQQGRYRDLPLPHYAPTRVPAAAVRVADG